MGMSGDTALALAKSYVKKTLQGQGALKGEDGFSPTVKENPSNTADDYRLDVTDKNGTFTTPNLKEDSKYIAETYATKVQVDELKSDLAYLREKDIFSLERNGEIKRVNWWNKNDINDNTSYIGSDAYINKRSIFESDTDSHNENYIRSNVIPIKPGDVIRCTTNGYGNNICLADKTGLIKAIKTVTLTGDGYTVEDGYYFCRLITTRGSDSWNNLEYMKNNVMVTRNEPIPTTYTAYGNYETPNLQISTSQITDYSHYVSDNQWNGKKCATIGSSITEMGGWSDIVKSALGLSKMYNRGSGETTLANLSSYNLGSGYPTTRYVYTDTTRYDEANNTVFATSSSDATTSIDAWYCSDGRINVLPTDADLVIFDACTNDAYRVIQYATDEQYQAIMSSATFGNIWTNENYDIATLEGAFYTFVKNVQVRCPNARIVCLGMPINSLFTTNNGYLTKFMEMYNKIEELCRKSGVVFIDTMMLEGANKFNITSYHNDYVHPATTDLGKRSVANSVIGVLKNVYPKNYVIG